MNEREEQFNTDIDRVLKATVEYPSKPTSPEPAPFVSKDRYDEKGRKIRISPTQASHMPNGVKPDMGVSSTVPEQPSTTWTGSTTDVGQKEVEGRRVL